MMYVRTVDVGTWPTTLQFKVESFDIYPECTAILTGCEKPYQKTRRNSNTDSLYRGKTGYKPIMTYGASPSALSKFGLAGRYFYDDRACQECETKTLTKHFFVDSIVKCSCYKKGPFICKITSASVEHGLSTIFSM